MSEAPDLTIIQHLQDHRKNNAVGMTIDDAEVDFLVTHITAQAAEIAELKAKVEMLTGALRVCASGALTTTEKGRIARAALTPEGE